MILVNEISQRLFNWINKIDSILIICCSNYNNIHGFTFSLIIIKAILKLKKYIPNFNFTIRDIIINNSKLKIKYPLKSKWYAL